MKFIKISALLFFLSVSPALAETNLLIAQKKQQSPPPTQVTSPSYNTPPLEIKVGILLNVSSATIASSQNAYLLDRSGQILSSVPANQAFNVKPANNSLIINNRTYPGVVFLQPPTGNYVYIGSKWYRGRVLLVSTRSKSFSYQLC